METLSTEDSKFTHHSAPVGYWGWEPAGKPVSIQIRFEVVERMLGSIIDGFGSIPKRGAEVGGLLLGTIVSGSPLIYRIEDFFDVLCMHKFGPSYVFSDEDHETLKAALDNASRDSRGLKVIGFYRSHTRDGLFLAPEDNDLLNRYFSDPEQIVLLVRPAAMGVSQAGFFYREDGAFPPSTPLEFPFRRSELETGSAPVRRPLGERLRGEQGRRPLPPQGFPAAASAPSREPLSMPSPAFRRDEMQAPPPTPAAQPQAPDNKPNLPYGLRTSEEDVPMPSQVYAVTTPSQSRFRRGWYWLPLSFIFLLLGVLLGFQSAMTIYPSSRSGPADAYTLALSINRSGDDVNVRWDRQSPAVRASRRGMLEITDGKYSKHVELDSQQLQSGSVIYRFSSGQLKFKLDVFPQDHISVSETVEWSDTGNEPKRVN